MPSRVSADRAWDGTRAKLGNGTPRDFGPKGNLAPNSVEAASQGLNSRKGTQWYVKGLLIVGNPYKVVPRTVSVNGLGQNFDYSLPPYSATVLRLSVGDNWKGRNYDENAGRQNEDQD